jgi:hypothetical protein
MGLYKLQLESQKFGQLFTLQVIAFGGQQTTLLLLTVQSFGSEKAYPEAHCASGTHTPPTPAQEYEPQQTIPLGHRQSSAPAIP